MTHSVAPSRRSGRLGVGFARNFAVGLACAFSALGWGVPAQAQVSGPSAFSETYGNWTVRCAIEEKEGESKRQCVMEQRFIWQDSKSGQRQPLLTVTLVPLDSPNKGFEAVVVTPFGLQFKSGLRLRADEAPSTLLAFETCFPNGCVARGPLSPIMVESFRAGVVLHVDAEPAAGGEPFRLEGSLKGFTDAIGRLLGEVGSR